MKFNKQRTWFSGDLEWAVIKRFSDDRFALYHKGEISYFDFVGLFNTTDEINNYFKTHKEKRQAKL